MSRTTQQPRDAPLKTRPTKRHTNMMTALRRALVSRAPREKPSCRSKHSGAQRSAQALRSTRTGDIQKQLRADLLHVEARRLGSGGCVARLRGDNNSRGGEHRAACRREAQRAAAAHRDESPHSRRSARRASTAPIRGGEPVLCPPREGAKSNAEVAGKHRQLLPQPVKAVTSCEHRYAA